MNEQQDTLSETRNHLDLVQLEQEEDLQVLLDTLLLSDDEFEEEKGEKYDFFKIKTINFMRYLLIEDSMQVYNFLHKKWPIFFCSVYLFFLPEGCNYLFKITAFYDRYFSI